MEPRCPLNPTVTLRSWHSPVVVQMVDPVLVTNRTPKSTFVTITAMVETRLYIGWKASFVGGEMNDGWIRLVCRFREGIYE
jgi:hypothetical protein